MDRTPARSRCALALCLTPLAPATGWAAGKLVFVDVTAAWCLIPTLIKADP